MPLYPVFRVSLRQPGNSMNEYNARLNMIKQQLRTNNVLDEKILNLFDSLPREDFVPTQYAPFAFADMHIPLPHNQCMMTPLEEGLLLQSLALTGHETVLEIGTGSGYLTAMLSQLCQQVTSIDYFPEFTEKARVKLNQHECHNVELMTGNGANGWLEEAPYDVIVFTGALKKLTESHFLQILPGGKLFALVGEAPCIQGQLHTVDQEDIWHQTLVFETNIPALLDQLQPETFIF